MARRRSTRSVAAVLNEVFAAAWAACADEETAAEVTCRVLVADPSGETDVLAARGACLAAGRGRLYSAIPPDALWQHNRYAWYFPYVNERLRRLDRQRDDLVLAPWDEVSDRRGLTYDAIHPNPEGAALMARTIRQAIQAEGRLRTRIVPPPPGDCG